MPKLKSKNNLKQTMWLSMPAIVLACCATMLHNSETPHKAVIALEKTKLSKPSFWGGEAGVLVTVQYRPQDWYSRRFKKVPKFVFGPTTVLDSRNKVQLSSLSMGGPVCGAAGDSILAPGSDGSLRYQFNYDLDLTRVPKSVSKLRLLSSISAEGITLPINVVVRQ